MRLLLVPLLCLLSWPLPGLAQDRPEPPTRERAVALARAGDLAPALDMLEALHAADPGDLAVTQDYIVVLGWAGQDARAVELFETLPRDQAADYVIAGAARSYRSLGRTDRALDLYRYGRSRWPGQTQFAAGEVNTLIDAGQPEAAVELARQLAEARPRDAEAQATYGNALLATGREAEALAQADRVLADQPEQREALRLRILALSETGSPEAALALAERHPGLMTDAEIRRIEANAVALGIRTARQVQPGEADRFAQTDRALAELDRQIAEWSNDPSARAALLNARYDRIVALRDRYRMTEAIEDYQRLLAEGIEPPAYVLSAVGDAYLYRRQPEMARDLYRAALEDDPRNLETRLQLVYAYTELEDFAAARELVDELNEEQPIWLPVVEGRSLLENPDRLRTETARAGVRLYAGDLAEAQELYSTLAERAPRNSLGYEGLGNVYLARGWPRRALEEFDQGLAVERLNRESGAVVGPSYGLEVAQALAWLDLHDYRRAGAAVADLVARFPEQIAVQRLARLWDVHTMRELRVAVEAGFNSGATAATGETELSIDSQLFSQPIYYNFRAFIGYLFAQADFPEETETLHRVRVGAEYRGPGLIASGEVSYNNYGETDPGGRLAALWMLDDYWSVEGSLEAFSRDTPLQALLNDVTANSAQLGVTYRASELFNVRLAGQVLDFSDDNVRSLGLLSLVTRLYRRPDFLIDGGIDLSISHNTESDVPYFSPELDSAQTASVAFEHLLYRRYENAWSHRLTLTAGNYWQENFGSDFVGGVRYEHRLLWNDVIDVSLGGGYNRQVYDGDPEDQFAILGRLTWRF